MKPNFTKQRYFPIPGFLELSEAKKTQIIVDARERGIIVSREGFYILNEKIKK